MVKIVLLERETFECKLERGVGISQMNISGRHIQAERKDNTELEGISPGRNNFFLMVGMEWRLLAVKMMKREPIGHILWKQN